MTRLILFLVVVAVALAVLILLPDGDAVFGEAHLSLGGYSARMSLPTLGLGMLVFLAGVYATLKVLGLPKRVAEYFRKRKRRRAVETLIAATRAALEGEWRDARKRFHHAADHADFAHCATLFAARCAIEAGDYALAREDLQKAQLADATDTFGVPLAQAELLVKTRQLAQARTYLEKLRSERPRNTKVAELSLQLCETDGDWTPLRHSLWTLRAPDQQARAASALLKDAAENKDASVIEEVWRQLDPSAARRVMPEYTQALCAIGQSKRAEKTLAQTLERDWDDACARAYAELEEGDAEARLAQAEKWLERDPDAPGRLLCVGMLCRRAKQYDRAKHYLTRSFADEQSPQAAVELAKTLIAGSAYASRGGGGGRE